MSSAEQIAANRRNAKASTGPNTAAGKTRTRRNALSHGLAASLPSDPWADAEVVALAAAFVGGLEQPPGVLARAREAAVAQQHLLRARAVRVRLINEALANPETYRRQDPGRANKPLVKKLLAAFTNPESGAFDQVVDDDVPEIPASEAEREVRVLERMAPDLERLDRYERRSLSRRKRALRELDKLQDAGP